MLIDLVHYFVETVELVVKLGQALSLVAHLHYVLLVRVLDNLFNADWQALLLSAKSHANHYLLQEFRVRLRAQSRVGGLLTVARARVVTHRTVELIAKSAWHFQVVINIVVLSFSWNLGTRVFAKSTLSLLRLGFVFLNSSRSLIPL